MILKSICEVSREELKEFSCGSKNLDNFLKKYALENDQNGYGKTFVLYDNKEIVGFFTLFSSSIKFEEFPIINTDLCPRYPIPCIRIARLGVRKDKQKCGYGRELLKQAFLKILTASTTVGIRLVVVDAKETSVSFYENFGFLKLLGDKLSYYLMLETIKEAYLNPLG